MPSSRIMQQRTDQVHAKLFYDTWQTLLLLLFLERIFSLVFAEGAARISLLFTTLFLSGQGKGGLLGNDSFGCVGTKVECFLSEYEETERDSAPP